MSGIYLKVFLCAAAAAESRRQALATAGRGSTFPLGRSDTARSAALRTLSVPVTVEGTTAGGSAAAAAEQQQLGEQPQQEAAPQPQPQPGRRQDPFRVNVPPSAFQLEERRIGAGEPALIAKLH